MDNFNFMDLLNEFVKKKEQPSFKKLGDEWMSIADDTKALSVRCGKLLELKNA